MTYYKIVTDVHWMQQLSYPIHKEEDGILYFYVPENRIGESWVPGMSLEAYKKNYIIIELSEEELMLELPAR